MQLASNRAVLVPTDRPGDLARGATRLFRAIHESEWPGTIIEARLPSPKIRSHRWRGGRTVVGTSPTSLHARNRQSPIQVFGTDQHTYAMDCIVGDEDICVEVTEADEAVRDVLWFLTGDDKLPSVDAERTFLVYGKDGRDVGVWVEIKILRRRPPRHRRAACSMAWRWRFFIV